MDTPDTQARLHTQLAQVARALSNAHRLMLLEHIAQGERSVERLSRLTDLTIDNTSQHLQNLRRAGFVESRRDGKNVLYRLSNGPVLPLLAAIRSYAEHTQAEVRELIAAGRGRGDGVEEIGLHELLQRLEEDSVTLLDVRAEDEYAVGHLPGALNIPAGELEHRLADLPTDQEIVAYCRGAYCVLSLEVAKTLQDKGYKVRRLMDGVPEWRAAGHPVATRM